ncbi:acyl-CoA dehydrogenase family protein [Ilumatobacter coccineus]|jgi:3-hydroxy-9,10-secoandrosta-1,3,5(10)-triene-9,17-dione monooxygenase|uniref:Pigment production hydroxylase n=1 Tax=Ilumatobacter coccineus (strain NBRC 103263 / KCTC 29153 / YM16-304) TaxID=1313172 RepID=A0A6C7EA40_ILUCY|nr:acyl-CoA dehydrogenase family protein [Ilumatobacter coccineus]BAN02005.1 pigment production hydroxylase [Ilumatobacter coccineus YM16-304]
MMTHDDCIRAARNLAPLLSEKARDGEIARRPLDDVIEAARDSGLFSMMVPKRYGGHELDVDTFFEVVLILSEADAAMGWLIGFYIEHAFWLAEYPEAVQDEAYGDADHVLAPAALNIAGGTATPTDGGYLVNGRWSWGTGIVHATWVIAGCIAMDADGGATPMMFLLPRDEVDTIDTWHISGMCSTGSLDFTIDDVFVPEDRAVPFLGLLDGSWGIAARNDAPLYSTPLVPILALAAGLPCLGAARGARAAFGEQVKEKIGATGMVKGEGNFGLIAEASLSIDAAELLMRDSLAKLLAHRHDAGVDERSAWVSQIAHAVFMCRTATNTIASLVGASGAMLDNPIQRFARDINTASNHVVFERESRYGDHARQLFGQPITNQLV